MLEEERDDQSITPHVVAGDAYQIWSGATTSFGDRPIKNI
jgi:hypothetical protein